MTCKEAKELVKSRLGDAVPVLIVRPDAACASPA